MPRPQQTDGHAADEVADAVHKPDEAEASAEDRLGQQLGRVAALRRFDERVDVPTATNCKQARANSASPATSTSRRPTASAICVYDAEEPA